VEVEPLVQFTPLAMVDLEEGHPITSTLLLLAGLAHLVKETQVETLGLERLTLLRAAVVEVDRAALVEPLTTGQMAETAVQELRHLLPELPLSMQAVGEAVLLAVLRGLVGVALAVSAE
jgi:hypothetical protein